mgnify:FL=1
MIKFKDHIYVCEGDGYLEKIDNIGNISLVQKHDYEHIYDIHMFDVNHYLLCCFQGLVEVKHSQQRRIIQGCFFSII